MRRVGRKKNNQLNKILSLYTLGGFIFEIDSNSPRHKFGVAIRRRGGDSRWSAGGETILEALEAALEKAISEIGV